jgi:hypothetical protein
VPAARAIAIDWSGRRGADQRRALWLAEARGGALVRLECGRTRDELVALLVDEAERDPDLVVGLDFAFSLPAWYVRQRGLTARSLWALLAEQALTASMRRLGLADWLRNPEPPFWTTSDGYALLAPHQRFRRTEREVRGPGVQPKSVFQLVGAGQVGRGSLYGMQALDRLATAGFRIWPFDSAEPPLVVEIFPRLLVGSVVKSSPAERVGPLAALDVPPELRARAATSDHAFDAAVSALALETAATEVGLAAEASEYALEGRIWPG